MQTELLGRHNASRHDAEDAAGTAVIPEADAADTPEVRHLADPFRALAGSQRLVGALRHHAKQQRFDVDRTQRIDLLHRLHLAIDTHQRLSV